MKLLTLVMIVRNNAPTIRATIESALPHVDRAVIVDTGSDDGTRDVAASLGDKVSLVERSIIISPITSIIDFAATRNMALSAAWAIEASVFTLMLSSDEYLRGGEALRAFLAAHRDDAAVGAYSVLCRFGESRRFYYPHVLRSAAGWRYEGPVHEIPAPTLAESAGHAIIPVAHIDHDVGDPTERLRVLRERDAPALEKLLAANPPPHLRARYTAHLAQTFEALAGAEPADVPGGERISLTARAMALHMRRVELGGSPDEVACARLGYLNCAWSLGLYREGEMIARLEECRAADPLRPELPYMIAACEARRGNFPRSREMACEAVRLAREAREMPFTLTPVDDSIEKRAIALL